MRLFNRLVSTSPDRQLISTTSAVSILFAVILLFATPQTVLAATYTVCPVGCDFTSPELAVDNNVAIADGDTIDVTPGTGPYVLSATIQVVNSITILGHDTVFDGNGMQAMTVSGAGTNLTLTNVTIRNGKADITTGGGAIWISGGAIVNVVNVIFENNQADFGGAVYNSGSSFNADAAIFIGNHATSGNGGALLTDALGSSYLNQSIIDGNTASVAGGGLAVEGNDPQNVNDRSVINLSNSTVSNNAALDPVQTVSNLPISGTTNSCVLGPLGQTFLADAPALSAFEFDIRLDGGGIPSDLDIIGQVREGGPFGPVIATAHAFAPGGVWPGGSTQTLVFYLDQLSALIPGNTYAIESTISGAYSIYQFPGKLTIRTAITTVAVAS